MLPIAITYISMGCITKLKYVTGSVKPIALGFCANVLVMLACCAFSLIFIVCAGSVFDLILSFFTFNAGTLLFADNKRRAYKPISVRQRNCRLFKAAFAFLALLLCLCTVIFTAQIHKRQAAYVLRHKAFNIGGVIACCGFSAL